METEHYGHMGVSRAFSRNGRKHTGAVEVLQIGFNV